MSGVCLWIDLKFLILKVVNDLTLMDGMFWGWISGLVTRYMTCLNVAELSISLIFAEVEVEP